MAEHIYMARCGQIRADKKRCPAILNVMAKNERVARERLADAAKVLGWRLGAAHHTRCASHLVGGGWNGTWVEL